MKQWIRDYFSFTKKERIGITSISVIIFVILYLPGWLRPANAVVPASVGALFRQGQEQLAEHAPGLNRERVEPGVQSFEDRQETSDGFSGRAIAVVHRFFQFDPNTASDLDWRALGATARNIHTIRNFCAKGGHFYRPEDLGRIYGVDPALVARLTPFIRLASNHRQGRTGNYQRFGKPAYVPQHTPYSSYTGTGAPFQGSYSFPRKSNTVLIDVNLADTSAFMTLQGIGAKLAQRIVNFRDKLGGFYAVSQVGETFGLPDSVFRKIAKQLFVKEDHIRKINLNDATVEMLRAHPYVRWAMANAIVKFRQEHGAFQSTDDLREIAVLTPENLEKLKPYFSTN